MSQASDRFLQLLQEDFSEKADPENAFFMKKYMKNRFPFFGIKTPERKAISKACIKEAGPFNDEDLERICRACFQKPEREWQYVVNERSDEKPDQKAGPFLYASFPRTHPSKVLVGYR